MPHAEPLATAAWLALAGALLLAAVLSVRTSQRFGIPLALAFLCVGMLGGSEGLGRIPFEDYATAFRLGTFALALILFEGGLNTPLEGLRRHYGPPLLLATVGVAGTALLVGLAARLLGFPWGESLLLGAVVSSTDASALYAVLQGSGLKLTHRVGLSLEMESGFNDPVAVLLTVALTRALLGGGGLAWSLLWQVPYELAVGAAGGWLLAKGALWILQRRAPRGPDLLPLLTSAVALLAYGLPTLLGGSGFLAAYVAGAVMGAGRLPHRASLLRVQASLAWFAQVSMFLMLGLLVFPSRLLPVALPGLALALFLALIARPLVVAACLRPFGFSGKETFFIGWVGLRGAVPIILATFPVLARVPGAEGLFDLVFFMVVVNALLPGATVAWTARRLGLEHG